MTSIEPDTSAIRALAWLNAAIGIVAALLSVAPFTAAIFLIPVITLVNLLLAARASLAAVALTSGAASAALFWPLSAASLPHFMVVMQWVVWGLSAAAILLKAITYIQTGR